MDTENSTYEFALISDSHAKSLNQLLMVDLLFLAPLFRQKRAHRSLFSAFRSNTGETVSSLVEIHSVPSRIAFFQ